MAAKFPMVNDFTGEEKQATLDDETELRANGFRIVTGGPYDAAIAERRAEEAAAVPDRQPTIVELQTNSDAALTASRTYPAADGGDDKPSKKDMVPPTDEGEAPTAPELRAADQTARARAAGNEEVVRANQRGTRRS